MSEALQRFAFKTSREAEFCDRKELTAQTGHPPKDWPVVALKELVDNALDAAEEAETAPNVVVEVSTERCEIIVTDNGPGLPAETIENILDYRSRTSSRSAYVSPSRGQQGNALQTIFAMAFALDEARGETLIETNGAAHRIVFEMDRRRLKPRTLREIASSDVQIGTRITVRWPVNACNLLKEAEYQFVQLACGFTTFNPHITMRARWDDEEFLNSPSTDTAWRKWRPRDATSAHWYTVGQFERYLAAHVARDEDLGITGRTVREFVKELRGLKRPGLQKLVLAETESSGITLATFFDRGRAAISALLDSCQRHTPRRVKPEMLGLIGSQHLLEDCRRFGAAEESFEYRKHLGTTKAGLPYSIEMAFAYRPEASYREIIAGINFSPAIDNPFERLGYFESLLNILDDQYIKVDDPVVLAMHYASPVPNFSDRGKSSLILPDEVKEEIIRHVKSVTDRWAKTRRAEKRSDAAEYNRRIREIRMLKQRHRPEKKEPAKPTGILGEKLSGAAATLGLWTRKEIDTLAVFSPTVDPYLAWRQRPTAEWFAELFAQFVPPDKKQYLRGLFYKIIMSTTSITALDGKPFVNEKQYWRMLQRASKAARWLGLVPFNRIVDERNTPPVIYVPPAVPILTRVSPGQECNVPSTFDEAKPRLYLDGFYGKQTHRLIFYGEKTSLSEVLDQIARQIGAEMILCTGESSDTFIADAAKRIHEDGRPAVVLYFSDFDPSGYQMPVSVGRKLQALRDLYFPDLEVELHQVAVTCEQIRQLGLPGSPLKAKEKRAAHWRETFGHEQTEIDAMVALHPDALRDATLDAVKPFYDDTLDRRVLAAKHEWEKKANALQSRPDYEDVSTRIVDAWKQVAEAAKDLESAQEQATQILQDNIPELPELPKANPVGEAKQPLFDTRSDFITATQRLIRTKKLIGIDDEADEEDDE